MHVTSVSIIVEYLAHVQTVYTRVFFSAYTKEPGHKASPASVEKQAWHITPLYDLCACSVSRLSFSQFGRTLSIFTRSPH